MKTVFEKKILNRICPTYFLLMVTCDKPAFPNNFYAQPYCSNAGIMPF